MHSISLIRNGSADSAFELREIAVPQIQDGEVLVKVEGFGLNYADVLARKGLYPDCPPLPAVLGYEAVGHIVQYNGSLDLKEGDRVLAFTRFGAYSEYAITDERAVIKIDDDLGIGEACALVTQYCTAYFSMNVATNAFPGEKVLVHSAAGGVGTAFCQLAKIKGLEVYGTVGSDEKLSYLKEQGVHQGINYRKNNFYEVLKSQNLRMDLVFDPVGGKVFKQSLKLLNYGGRIVTFGAASRSKGNLFTGLELLFGFGFYSPLKFLMKSQSMLGVNMLRIGDHKPELLANCLSEVVKLTREGKLNPQVDQLFSYKNIAQAHAHLESRNSKGKIAVSWND
ncbi:MAG TPA: alcohol dehydrogenase [Flavobacteriales bacterium]|jgi:NADPH2:quinone reductase|nr:zinc-binding dehydrogenase [Salibacteraceae bacterium]HAS34930.1 alcohol dehydrogenase [Flavobacteriales bacterium]